jgi:hypothetical protein
MQRSGNEVLTADGSLRTFCSQADTKHQFGGKAFLNFDRLTLVPLQQKMIDLEVCSSSLRSLLLCAYSASASTNFQQNGHSKFHRLYIC